MYKAGQVVLALSSLLVSRCFASPVQAPADAAITASPQQSDDASGLDFGLIGYLTDASQLDFEVSAIRSAVQSISARLDGVDIGTVSYTITSVSGLDTVLASQLQSLMPTQTANGDGAPQTVSLSICVPTPGSWAGPTTAGDASGTLGGASTRAGGLFGDLGSSVPTASSTIGGLSIPTSIPVSFPTSESSVSSSASSSSFTSNFFSDDSSLVSLSSSLLGDGGIFLPATTSTAALTTSAIFPSGGQELSILNGGISAQSSFSTAAIPSFDEEGFPLSMVTSFVPASSSVTFDDGQWHSQFGPVAPRNDKDGSIFGPCSSPEINGHPIRRDAAGNIVILQVDGKVGGFDGVLGQAKGQAKSRRSYIWDLFGCL